MDHAVDIWMLLKNRIKRSLFRDISLEEVRSLPADELDTVERLF